MSYRAHWIALLAVIVGSFAILAGFAPRIRSAAPPLPSRVVGPGGAVVIEGEAIRRGQNVWQSIGGQEVGSIWGHGAYVAPDWTADWLHREATFMLDRWAREEGIASGTTRSRRSGRRRSGSGRPHALRENTYDPETGAIRVGAERAAAFDAGAAHDADVFARGRDAYAIPAGALDDPARARDLAAFFFWTTWAGVTNRPGQEVTYTKNWPHEPLVGNRPTGGRRRLDRRLLRAAARRRRRAGLVPRQPPRARRRPPRGCRRATRCSASTRRRASAPR